MSKLPLFDVVCDGPGDGRRCVVPGRAHVGHVERSVESVRYAGVAKGWHRRRKADICPACQIELARREANLAHSRAVVANEGDHAPETVELARWNLKQAEESK